MPEFVNFEFSLRRPEEVNHSIQNIQRVQKNQKLCQIFEVFQTTGAGSKRTVLETFSEEQLTSVPKLAARADCVQPPKSPKRIKNPKKNPGHRPRWTEAKDSRSLWPWVPKFQNTECLQDTLPGAKTRHQCQQDRTSHGRGRKWQKHIPDLSYSHQTSGVSSSAPKSRSRFQV